MLKLSLFVLLFSFNSWSDDSGPCREEFKKACGNVEKGDGRVHDCMTKNMSTFSPACQEKAKKRDERHQKHQACHEEMKKFCGDVPKGDGKKKKCLEENLSKLSPDCQAMGAKLMERVQKRGERKKEEKAPESAVAPAAGK